MTEPLVVDPTRLKTAGTELQIQVLPDAPSPFVAAATDSISAAINESLPIIESPVIKALPAIKAALTKTGSSVVAAADLYAETDSRLGEHVAQVQFLAAPTPRMRSVTSTGLAAESADAADDAEAPTEQPAAETPAPPAAVDPLAGVVPQLGQVTTAAGPLGTMAQSVMQNTQGVLGGMPTGAAASPQPAAPAADQDGGDAEKESTEELTEGAAQGDQPSGTAPVGQSIPSRPEAAASQVGGV